LFFIFKPRMSSIIYCDLIDLLLFISCFYLLVLHCTKHFKRGDISLCMGIKCQPFILKNNTRRNCHHTGTTTRLIAAVKENRKNESPSGQGQVSTLLARQNLENVPTCNRASGIVGSSRTLSSNRKRSNDSSGVLQSLLELIVVPTTSNASQCLEGHTTSARMLRRRIASVTSSHLSSHTLSPPLVTMTNAQESQSSIDRGLGEEILPFSATCPRPGGAPTPTPLSIAELLLKKQDVRISSLLKNREGLQKIINAQNNHLTLLPSRYSHSPMTSSFQHELQSDHHNGHFNKSLAPLLSGTGNTNYTSSSSDWYATTSRIPRSGTRKYDHSRVMKIALEGLIARQQKMKQDYGRNSYEKNGET